MENERLPSSSDEKSSTSSSWTWIMRRNKNNSSTSHRQLRFSIQNYNSSSASYACRAFLSIRLVLLLLLLLMILLPAQASQNGGSGVASTIAPLTRFDSKGELPQADAAAKAVARGGPVLAIGGLKEEGYLFLLAPCLNSGEGSGRLLDGKGPPKLWRLTEEIYLGHAGLSQDSRVLLLAAQQVSLDHESRFGEAMEIGEVVEYIAARQQEATMQSNKRPFGSSILVTGLVSMPNGRWIPRIYRTDPSGAYSLWKACIIGQGADEIIPLLEKRYHADMSLEEALIMASECCKVLGKKMDRIIREVDVTVLRSRPPPHLEGEASSRSRSHGGVVDVTGRFPIDSLPSLVMESSSHDNIAMKGER